MKRYDVSIIGSGPAAMSTAIVLAQHGFNVVVFFKDELKRDLGETLSHLVTPSLIELGVLSLFHEIKLEPIKGTISSWGSALTEKTTSLLNPFGIGWILQKQAFNRILVDQAVSLGVSFCTDQINQVERKHGIWRTSTAEFSQSFSSELIVVATGRKNTGFTKFSRKVPVDKLVACVLAFDDDNHDSSINVINVDSSANGWFFSVKSNNNTRILSYFTDGDLLDHKSLPAFLKKVNQDLPDLPSISTTIKHVNLAKTKLFYIVPANSMFRKESCGDGLICCGDSAQTFDPLSSQGVATAIRDGIEAANFIARFEYCKESIIEYDRNRRQKYIEYLINRYNIYSTEKRWAGNIFWKRRQDVKYSLDFVNTFCIK